MSLKAISQMYLWNTHTFLSEDNICIHTHCFQMVLQTAVQPDDVCCRKCLKNALMYFHCYYKINSLHLNGNKSDFFKNYISRCFFYSKIVFKFLNSDFSLLCRKDEFGIEKGFYSKHWTAFFFNFQEYKWQH